jgi:hypothetical protein
MNSSFVRSITLSLSMFLNLTNERLRRHSRVFNVIYNAQNIKICF